MSNPFGVIGSFLRSLTSAPGVARALPYALTFFGGGAVVGVLVVLFATGGGDNRPVEGRFFEIGTGSVTGTYYPLGNTISSIIANPAGSVRCADATRCGPAGLTPVVQATEGSVANVNAVHRLRMQSAFAQANVLNDAWNGNAPFPAAFEDLRAVSGLYQEMVHLVVARGSEIESVADLRGMRVSIDRDGSGTNGIARMILEAANLSERRLTLVTAPADQAAEMLLSGDLDAFFFVAGPPVRAVAGLADLHLVDLVPLSGEDIDALVAAQPFLTTAAIPAETYLGVEEVTPTIGVTAIWIVHESAEFDLIYDITRALWNGANKQMLNTGPEQAQLMSAQTAVAGVPIPFHPGAAAFYREAGFLNDPDE